MFVLLCSVAQAAPSVRLAWDANTEPDIRGYRLHYGTTAGIYDHTLDVGNVTTASVPDLPGGNTYFFVVTAYNRDDLESLPSNEATYTQRPVVAVSLATQSLDPAHAEDYLLCEAVPAQSPSTIAEHCLADGSYQFAVNGPAGRAVSIYASADLAEWTLIGTVANPTGLLLVTDFEAASRAQSRFYKVLQRPAQFVSLTTQSIDPANAGDYTICPAEPPGTPSAPGPHCAADENHQFAVSGPAGQRLSIYASTDLTTWTHLGTVANPTGILLITDYEAASAAETRFYRLFQY